MELNIDAQLRRSLSEMIRSSSKSREQIANELTAILRCKVTVHILNGFTAESKSAVRFPAAWIPAFCEVLNDDRLMLLVATRNVPVGEWTGDLEEISSAVKRLLTKMRSGKDAGKLCPTRPFKPSGKEM